MTIQIKQYTDSAISDSITQFFNRYKENNSYKYVEMIDSRVIQSKVIEIDFLNFSDEIKKMLEEQSKERIHTAIYRAISEVFQTKYGNGKLENAKQDDIIKFRISNFNIFDDKVCSNPKLIHYEDYKKEDYEGEEKITNVVIKLKKNNTFVTIRKFEEILLYNGKIYDNLQADTIIKEETEKLIPNCTKHNTLEVIDKIKRQTYTDIEDFDKDPNLITIENGILNLETLERRPHTPKHLSRVLLPVEYHKPKYEIKDETIFEDIEKNLKNTLFWKFLKSSFTVDGKFQEKEFQTALEVTACPIVKRTIDEKAIMNLGRGDNGKSVLLGYIVDMLGKNNVSNIALQNLSDDKYMSSNLAGKSANIFTDLERNELKHTGLIKAIVSNEGIEVQKKYYDAFNIKPFCKLMFSANRFPKSYDQSEGFFRRWIIINWRRSFGNDPERDPHLKEKLRDNLDERNLVFSCLVSLANKLNKVGKFTHSKDWKTIQREWNENADPIDNFDTNYIIDSEQDQSKRDTYIFYKEICHESHEKGETPLGMGQFSKAFAEYRDEFVEKREGKTTRVWLGIDFKRPIQTGLEEFDKKDKK